MDENDQRLATDRARVFKAMGHPTRMYLVSLLESGPRNVGELTKAAGYDISTVSKHLSILRSAGVVVAATRGQCVYYSLFCACVPEFVRCVDEIVLRKARHKAWRRVEAPAPAGLL